MTEVVDNVVVATDSQITVYWANNHELSLTQWVFNRVQHVVLFLPQDCEVYHIAGDENPSDHVTK